MRPVECTRLTLVPSRVQNKPGSGTVDNLHEGTQLSPLEGFAVHMRLRGLSPVTVDDRLEILHRLHVWLSGPLLVDATRQQLIEWQQQFVSLAPATIDVYTRHVQAFYRWAADQGLMDTDPAAGLPRPRVPAGRPHPISAEDLRTVFAFTPGTRRTVFALAAFAGLRRGEIIRLQRADVDLERRTALLQGKGRKERIVPLVPPLVEELTECMPRSGYVVLHNGHPYVPDVLSVQCSRHLASLGIRSTLHSMRHAFGTNAYRTTRDLLLVAQLLGHASVRTTQIYAAPDMDDLQTRLQSMSDLAAGMLAPPRLLRAV